MKILDHKKELHDFFHYRHMAKVQAEPSEDYGTVEEFVAHVAMKAGYHPAGYGLNYPRMQEYPDGCFVVTWESARSCD